MVQAVAAGPEIERAFWYAWNDDGPDQSRMEDTFGVVRDWRTPKPAATAFRTLTQRLDGAADPRRLDLVALAADGPAASRRVLDDFEAAPGAPIWRAEPISEPPAANRATVARTTEQRHGGAASAEIAFTLAGLTGQGSSWVFPLLEDPIVAPGQPRRLGVWLKGDASGHLLWAVVKDQRQEFQVSLGAISPGGWQFRQAELADFADQLQYPISFLGFRIDNEPDGATGAGVIYVDDLVVEDGPAAYGYRFDRAGAHVDVLWAVGGAVDYALPSGSSAARVTTRDGRTATVSAIDGRLPLHLSDAPIFVEHQGRDAAPAPAPPPGAPRPPTALPNDRPFAHAAFQQRWAAADAGAAGRTYVYGPAPFTDGLSEPYVEGRTDQADGQRLVQYFDKARMELTQPTAPVTAGLLAVELISGDEQRGDGTFRRRSPARVPVAGDPDNPFPHYADLDPLRARAADQRGEGVAAYAARRYLPDRSFGVDEAARADPQARLTGYDADTGHNLPRAFADFREDARFGGVLTIGLAITEPVWVEARVGGAPKRVLVQAFERRVLTYTPDNPVGFQVEFGNIGRHYHTWRYQAGP
jgi:hypothetical protein